MPSALPDLWRAQGVSDCKTLSTVSGVGVGEPSLNGASDSLWEPEVPTTVS